MPEMRRGILNGSLYPRFMQGMEIEVRIEDDYWGRCVEHRTWVRLEDLTSIPEIDVDPVGEGSTTYAKGGTITAAQIKGSF